MPWYEVVGFIAFGFFVGTYGSMVGVGGGFLIVPLLLFLGVPARQAAGTSLVAVLLNGVSSTLSYLRQKRVDIKSGLIFSAAGIPGALLGAYVDQHVPHRVFTVLFGLLLIAVSVRAFLTRDEEPEIPNVRATAADTPENHTTRDFVDAMGVHHRYHYHPWAAVAVSAATGFLASMFGIGGGTVQVPAMVYLFGFPTHVAVATSQLIIFVTAVFGSASHAYYGDILWLKALLLGLGAIGGAQLGASLASRMRPGPLMRWFSAAIAFTALYLIYNSTLKH